MKKLLTILICTLHIGMLHAETASIRANVTTQMYEDGKIDKDRYFIFYITYLDMGDKSDAICDVVSVTINNKNCMNETLGNKGFWLKPEYSNMHYNGKENFVCKYRKINADSSELVITEKDYDYQLTHRLITNSKTKLLTDYKGQITKTSSITKKIETAEYRPLKAKSAFSGGWESVDLGCNRMTVPMISP